MELPVAKQSYLPSTDALVRALKRADAILARTAAEESELDGAIAFTNPRRPGVRMLNFAAEVHVPEGSTPEAVVAGVLDHFRAAGVRCHSLRAAEMTYAPALAEAVQRAGYALSKPARLYLLDSFRPPTHVNPRLQVIPARAAYAEVRRLARQGATAQWSADERTADDLSDTHVDFLDEPRLESYLGRLDRQSVGVASVLSLGNIGVITDLYTDAAHRRQGVASTLLTHLYDYCCRAQFEQVILECDEGNPAGGWYESLGFKPIAAFATYRLPEAP